MLNRSEIRTKKSDRVPGVRTPVAALIVLLAAAIAGCTGDRETEPTVQKAQSQIDAVRSDEAAGGRSVEQASSGTEQANAVTILQALTAQGGTPASRIWRLSDMSRDDGSEGRRRDGFQDSGFPDGVFRPSNVLLIVADGLPHGWIGSDGVATPNITALVQGGMTFRNVYSMPTAVASQATLLTGRYPNRHGWIGEWDVSGANHGVWFDWERETCLPRWPHLRYRTISIAGKWLLNDLQAQPDALLQHGFHRWCVTTASAEKAGAAYGSLQDPYLFLSGSISRESDVMPDRDSQQSNWGASGTFLGRFGPELFNEFLHVRQGGRSRRPFFAYYSMNVPGLPIVTMSAKSNPQDDTDRYRALVSYTDKLVGQLLAWLSSNDQLAGTLVIFTSSGGAPAGVHTHVAERDVSGGRGTLTERGVRVPLIAHCPGLVPTGVESDCLVDFSDLAPTLCELLEPRMPIQPDSFDGRSFRSVLTGKDVAGPREWIMSLGTGALEFDGEHVRAPHRFAERVLRDRRFKVHVDPERRIDALWDLESDPAEERNLVDSNETEHRRAIEWFEAVVAGMPEQDAELPYRPLLDISQFRATSTTGAGANSAGGG